ncbi:hypothetical protein KFE25_012895 [Diacronema lutheri]|uniref:Cyclic nucleotide-binding domain-containing protein n=1 Tax=Diacronema lutheri TaxID=2081491 RepID=A0A8J5X8Y9_DIALT|nr:hypothetical protein KFE25_012895 [Diacronema lutheri]
MLVRNHREGQGLRGGRGRPRDIPRANGRAEGAADRRKIARHALRDYHAGSHLCELRVLIADRLREATVTAVSFCSLFAFFKHELDELLPFHEDVQRDLQAEARSKLARPSSVSSVTGVMASAARFRDRLKSACDEDVHFHRKSCGADHLLAPQASALVVPAQPGCRRPQPAASPTSWQERALLDSSGCAGEHDLVIDPLDPFAAYTAPVHSNARRLAPCAPSSDGRAAHAIEARKPTEPPGGAASAGWRRHTSGRGHVRCGRWQPLSTGRAMICDDRCQRRM